MKCDDQTSTNNRHEHRNHEQHQHSQAHECSVRIYTGRLFDLLLLGWILDITRKPSNGSMTDDVTRQGQSQGQSRDPNTGILKSCSCYLATIANYCCEAIYAVGYPSDSLAFCFTFAAE